MSAAIFRFSPADVYKRQELVGVCLGHAVFGKQTDLLHSVQTRKAFGFVFCYADIDVYKRQIYNRLKPFCEKELGIKFTILHADKTYDDVFLSLIHISVDGETDGDED